MNVKSLPAWVVKFSLLLPSVAVLLVASCATQKVAPGIDPEPRMGFFARRMQMRLPKKKADVAEIFVGGFAEQVLAHARAIYEGLPPLPGGGRQLRAYYAWDGGRGCLLAHDTKLLQNDLRAFLLLNPKADVVLIGHSYGASAAMDVLRHLGSDLPRGRTVVLTIDPVSMRERSHPRERAEGVDYWINVYCEPYCHGKDILAAIGGPWRECTQADVNLRFSGRERDAKGRRYQHTRPDSLLMERPKNQPLSAYEHLLQVWAAFHNQPK